MCVSGLARVREHVALFFSLPTAGQRPAAERTLIFITLVSSVRAESARSSLTMHALVGGASAGLGFFFSRMHCHFSLRAYELNCVH